MCMVRVEWRDIVADLNTDQVPLPAVAYSLGFVEEFTDEYICLSTCVFKDDFPNGYGDKITIPLGVVDKIIILEKTNVTYPQEIKQDKDPL